MLLTLLVLYIFGVVITFAAATELDFDGAEVIASAVLWPVIGVVFLLKGAVSIFKKILGSESHR